jgi:hypothetical protein
MKARITLQSPEVNQKNKTFPPSQTPTRIGSFCDHSSSEPFNCYYTSLSCYIMHKIFIYIYIYIVVRLPLEVLYVQNAHC